MKKKALLIVFGLGAVICGLVGVASGTLILKVKLILGISLLIAGALLYIFGIVQTIRAL